MKVTKRDIAILGVFLVVVVVAAGFMIRKQVGGAGEPASVESEDLILAQTGPPPIPDTEIVPSSGLDVASGDIADPKAFETEASALGGLFPSFGRGGRASGDGASGGASEGSPGASEGSARPQPGSGGMAGGRTTFTGGGSGGGTVTVYIAALTTSGDRASALIVHKGSGARRWIDQGGSAFGYTLDYANLKGAVLESNGRYYVLELGEGGQSSDRAAPTAAGPAPVVASAPAQPSDSADTERLIGSWTGTMQGMTLTLTYGRGGSGSMSMAQMPQPMRFTWRIQGGKLRIAMDMGGMGGPGGNMEQSLSYRFEGDRTLYVSGGPTPGEMKLTKN